MENFENPVVKPEQVKPPVTPPVRNSGEADVAKAALKKTSGESSAKKLESKSEGAKKNDKSTSSDKSNEHQKTYNEADVARAAKNKQSDQNASDKKSMNGGANTEANNKPAVKEVNEKIKKPETKNTVPDKSPTVADVEKAAKQKSENKTEKGKEGEKPGKKDNPTDTQPKDYKDPVARIERTTQALGSQIEGLKKFKEQYGNHIEEALKTADTEYEKITAKGETIDNIAAAATMVANVGGIVKEGASAIKLTGEALAKSNAKLLKLTKDLAEDPIKGVAKDKLSKTVDGVMHDGFIKNTINFVLKIDKPSTWAQLVTGNLKETHKNVTEKLKRDLIITNDKVDEKIYNLHQQILELNTRRDEINTSNY